jgi:F-type H+-transporting ATPase subunit a
VFLKIQLPGELKMFIKFLLMSIFVLNYIFEIANVEIGQHFYWNLVGFEVHGQVLINSWIVFAIIFILAITTTKDLKKIPEDGQNFIESVTEFVSDIAKTQIGEEVSIY